MKLAVFFVPHCQKSGSQLQNEESEKRKSSLTEKEYFFRVRKISAFSSINADVLSQMSLNSMSLFFFYLFIDVSSRGCMVCRMLGSLANNELLTH